MFVKDFLFERPEISPSVYLWSGPPFTNTHGTITSDPDGSGTSSRYTSVVASVLWPSHRLTKLIGIPDVLSYSIGFPTPAKLEDVRRRYQSRPDLDTHGI